MSEFPPYVRPSNHDVRLEFEIANGENKFFLNVNGEVFPITYNAFWALRESIDEIREEGQLLERENIIQMFEESADRLETLRPESYKSVADKMDLRIRVIRFMIKTLKEDNADSKLGNMGQVGDAIGLLPS